MILASTLRAMNTTTISREHWKKHHEVTVGWKGIKYVGISLTLDYRNRFLHASVTDFLKKALNKYQHPTPIKPQHMPTKVVPINYGTKVQAPAFDNSSPFLPAKGKRQVQDNIGTFAWYSQATYIPMAHTQISITGRQSKATQQLCEEVTQVLGYCATHPDVMIRFHTSNIVLFLHSDPSHISEPSSKIRAAGHFFI